MAKDGYYVIVDQILSHLYQCLKKGKDVDSEDLTHEKLYDINVKYWLYIFEHMQKECLIEGFRKLQFINGTIGYDLKNVQITPAGIGYLLDNNFIAKAKQFLKGVKEIVAFV